jgi:hypothetical protein
MTPHLAACSPSSRHRPAVTAVVAPASGRHPPPGDVGLQLLENSIATALALGALI